MRVTPLLVEMTRSVADAAATIDPLVETATEFQLPSELVRRSQAALSPPGFRVIGIVKLGMSFTLVMLICTVAKAELSVPSFTLKVKLSAPKLSAPGL